MSFSSISSPLSPSSSIQVPPPAPQHLAPPRLSPPNPTPSTPTTRAPAWAPTRPRRPLPTKAPVRRTTPPPPVVRAVESVELAPRRLPPPPPPDPELRPKLKPPNPTPHPAPPMQPPPRPTPPSPPTTLPSPLQHTRTLPPLQALEPARRRCTRWPRERGRQLGALLGMLLPLKTLPRVRHRWREREQRCTRWDTRRRPQGELAPARRGWRLWRRLMEACRCRRVDMLVLVRAEVVLVDLGGRRRGARRGTELGDEPRSCR